MKQGWLKPNQERNKSQTPLPVLSPRIREIQVQISAAPLGTGVDSDMPLSFSKFWVSGL